MKTTNYFNTFIQVAEDCPTSIGEAPPEKKDKKTVANLQFEMISNHPYQYTSDDVLFSILIERKEIPENEREQEREIYFSKGQPCFRSSPLAKRYGWGVHYNKEGKMAVFGAESAEYKKLANDATLKQLKAMRSKK